MMVQTAQVGEGWVVAWVIGAGDEDEREGGSEGVGSVGCGCGGGRKKVGGVGS